MARLFWGERGFRAVVFDILSGLLKETKELERAFLYMYVLEEELQGLLHLHEPSSCIGDLERHDRVSEFREICRVEECLAVFIKPGCREPFLYSWQGGEVARGQQDGFAAVICLGEGRYIPVREYGHGVRCCSCGKTSTRGLVRVRSQSQPCDAVSEHIIQFNSLSTCSRRTV